MISNSYSRKVLLCVLSMGFVMLMYTMPLVAQEREAAVMQATEAVESEPVKMKRKLKIHKVKASEGNSLSQLKADIEQCGSACSMGGADSITAAGGGTRDYECDENGNCHCFGAVDCVAMNKICAPDTIGCNDQGCLCTEGDGGDG